MNTDYAMIMNCVFGDKPGTLCQDYILVAARRAQNEYLKASYDAEWQNLIKRRGVNELK